MEIVSVEYITHHPHPDENGEPIPVLAPHFKVETPSGEIFSVPLDPGNRHYHEIKEWYIKQNPKPFEFEFE